MSGEITLSEKYVRNGWPSLRRPDLKTPEGWSLSLITALNRIYNHNLSPDGKRVAYIQNHEKLADVYTQAIAGGWPARQTTDRAAIQFWWDERPQWSPDSQWLAFSNANHVYVVPSEGGIPQLVSGFTDNASSPVWMPDSEGLIISTTHGERSHLLLTNRKGKWPQHLTDTSENPKYKVSGDASDAQPSPDGSQVVFVVNPSEDLNRCDIVLLNLFDKTNILLAGAPAIKNLHPRWSPDGNWIAFLSQCSGFYEVWLVCRDGSQLRQLTHAGVDIGEIAWSPDGLHLAAQSNHDGAYHLVLIDKEDGSLQALRSEAGIHLHPNWAPDGSFITFEFFSPLSPPDIFRMDFPDRKNGNYLDGQVTQLTFSKIPALNPLKLVTPEPVTYQSKDGLEIHGLLYRPAHSNQAAILHPHGGPRDQYGYEWDIFTQYLVAKGYTYMAINYRGGTGYGAKFEHANDFDWGGGDTQDCLSGARFLAGLDEVDPQRIAIMGSSYGGYMTACCLSRDPEYLFACGVSLYGDADLFSSWAQCDLSTRLYTEMQIGNPGRQRAVFKNGSPVFEAANVQKPVLLLHGLDDPIVPPQASEEWAEALLKNGKTFEYKTYASETHGFLSRANLIDEYTRIERFLDWYLMPEA